MAKGYSRAAAGPVVLGLALALTMAGCKSASHNETAIANAQADNEATIRKLDATWARTAEAKDADGWVGFYADDAVVLPPNDKAMTDKKAIKKAIKELLGLPGLSLTWEPTKVEVAKSGDLAYLYGAYEMKMNDGKGQPVTDFGKNVEIWKKQANGSWRCVVDMWNSDLPPAPEAAK